MEEARVITTGPGPVRKPKRPNIYDFRKAGAALWLTLTLVLVADIIRYWRS